MGGSSLVKVIDGAGGVKGIAPTRVATAKAWDSWVGAASRCDFPIPLNQFEIMFER